GTGKTTVAVNLAHSLAARGEKVRLLDCDVEEPNDFLFIDPRFDRDQPVTVRKPVWDGTKCTACGRCAEACNYNAIAVVKEKVLIFNELCHACGTCSYVCPEGALAERDVPIGMVQVSEGPQPFFFAHGMLEVGEALAPAVVRDVKSHLDETAINLVDASPGTACPVVEAVRGADAAWLVTEPTPFGLNDLKLAVGLTLKLGIPTGIVINRSDGVDALIQEYADEVGLPVVGRIPFRREYAEAYSGGEILVQRFPELGETLLAMFDSGALALPPAPAEERFRMTDGEAPDFTRGNATDYAEITVISGKGGTGKTSVLASLARLAENAVLADNDVDAADLHLLLKPVVYEVHDFVGGTKAIVDPSKCTACGVCEAACHFDAIQFDGPSHGQLTRTYRVEPFACEGCGLCPRVCPVEAIRAEQNVTGQWYVSGTDCGPMAHARLGIAEENSGRLVTQVRNRAGQLAKELGRERILGDGPPGTGCPVIASVSGTDLVLIVTEPTVSGVHDMERVLQLANHFGVPGVVVINKADLNRSQAQRIEEIAAANGSRVIGRIPFDRTVNDALMQGKTVIEYGDSPAASAIRDVWRELQDCFGRVPPSERRRA
ncbi:MAG: 4Fe-4S binding protein, partial [Planctomycetes bacterium]|nr:4Fe-4S binding protein [Planctomycetota bacterium]